MHLKNGLFVWYESYVVEICWTFALSWMHFKMRLKDSDLKIEWPRLQPARLGNIFMNTKELPKSPCGTAIFFRFNENYPFLAIRWLNLPLSNGAHSTQRRETGECDIGIRETHIALWISIWIPDAHDLLFAIFLLLLLLLPPTCKTFSTKPNWMNEQNEWLAAMK